MNQHRTTPHPSRGFLSRRGTTVALLAVALFATACGSATTSDPGAGGDAAPPASDQATSVTDQPAPEGDETFPVTVLSGPLEGGTEVTVEAKPQRIVSLSPTTTEMLWAVGAGDQVVAVDDQSDYPEGVPSTDLSGYTPNIEAILSYEPDLVVTSDDPGDLVSGLAAVGVPTLLLPGAQDLEETYSQMERLGVATGNVGGATEAVADIRTRIEKAVADAPDLAGLTYYHELDPTFFTVTSDTFIGDVYGLFGMTSIADAAGTEDDYPQLSAEFIVASDPDLIVLSDAECCGVTVESIGERAGWDQLAAVRSGNVIVVDEDVASRWGPRVVEFVETIAEHADHLEPTPAG